MQFPIVALRVDSVGGMCSHAIARADDKYTPSLIARMLRVNESCERASNSRI